MIGRTVNDYRQEKIRFIFKYFDRNTISLHDLQIL